MSTTVTIPTASYTKIIRPIDFPSKKDFDQQAKLWRFYCTCLDLGCVNYRLEDYLNKNMTSRDKYLDWVSGWKRHYIQISNLIRLYKQARTFDWFTKKEQTEYREKLKKSNDRYANYNSSELFLVHQQIIRESTETLKRSAQHLLNARFTAKLASEALVARQKQIKQQFLQAAE